MTTVDWLLEHEPTLRLGAFLLFLALLSGLQHLRPRREMSLGWRRSATNLALGVINTIILRVAFPLLAFEFAVHLERTGTGLLHALPLTAATIIGVLLLDLIIFWQHRLLHKVPLLWRLHRVHHSDTGFDVTSGVRFHPLEIVLSMGLKIGLIWILGIVPLAVMIFELALSIGSLFTHTNLHLPAKFERRLRWLLVTPDMHRIHHSIHRDETDSNFGFHLSLWDRLFGSYYDRPRDGHTGMTIGLPEFRELSQQSLMALLRNPFRDSETTTSITKPN